MIAALILVISAATLLQFFISYARSLVAACGKQQLSEQAREVTGIQNHIVQGDDFRRLVQLVNLCPEPGDDVGKIRVVRAYFRLLNLLRFVAQPLVPAVVAWAEHEREGCSYFAAVALDRRIAYSRALMAEQLNNRL